MTDKGIMWNAIKTLRRQIKGEAYNLQGIGCLVRGVHELRRLIE